MTITRQRNLAIVTAGLCFALSAFVAHRGGIRLSFDSYYYVEFAKEFRDHAPASFGSAWPYGWPLLGAATGLFGLSAYHGLLALAGLSVLGLLILTSSALPWAELGLLPGLLLLAAVASLPILSALVTGVLSEIPFAVVLLAFALCLARWPNPRAIAGAALLALAAFVLRYAGALLLVSLVIWLVGGYCRLRESRRLALAVLVTASAGGIAVGLLLWNYASLGVLSGHPRGSGVPMAQWFGIAADFGWSLPTAIGGLALRNALGFAGPARFLLGFALFLGVIGTGWWAWWRGSSPAMRAVGAVTATYAIGLVALRCQGEFDSLSNARMFVPLLFPLSLIAAEKIPRPALVAVATMVLIVNACLNGKGASLEIGGDVQAAAPLLARAWREDTIGLNDHALTLAAWTDRRTVRVWPDDLNALLRHRFVVIAAEPIDRHGGASAVAPGWLHAVQQLVESHRAVTRLVTPGLIVLERTPPPP